VSDTGVLLVAIGAEAYMAQACLAAASVKRHAPGTTVLLATDRPDHPLVRAGYADRVEAIESPDPARYPLPFAAPLLTRVRMLQRSPFERTLHLDVDARLRAPRLDEMFATLDRVDIALAEAASDASIDRQLVGRPIFNNGIILWRRSPPVARLFAAFEQQYLAFLELAREAAPLPPQSLGHVADRERVKRLLCSDQIAMAEIFRPDHNPMGLSYAVLGEHWNWRGGVAGRRPFEPVVIDHHPDLRGNADRQLAGLAFEALAGGAGPQASAVYRWLFAAMAPDLLTAPVAALASMLQGEATGALARAAAEAPGTPPDLLRIAAFHAIRLGETQRAATLLQAVLGGKAAEGR
jgi:hypothetical protein